MKLDYVEKTRQFILSVPRGEADPTELMHYHGLDMSVPASTPKTAILFTGEPYAAAAFHDIATPRAMVELQDIVAEVASSWSDSARLVVPTPPGRELWPFQLADLAYALRRQHCLIGDQPGLGKTPVAIGYANAIGAKRVLVVCPANIRLQWATRITEWSTMSLPRVYPILKGRHGVSPSADWTIVSYDLAADQQINQALMRQDYDLLILDEAHYLKTSRANRTRSIIDPVGGVGLVSRAARVLALTGTPLPNRPRECYTLARTLCWDAIDWMSEDAFKSRFNPSWRGISPAGNIFSVEKTGRHAELQTRLRANFMVRHLKQDVLTQLRLPEFDIVRFEPTGPVKLALKAESMLHIDPNHLDGLDFVNGHIAAVRHMMGLALAPQVANYAEMVLVGGEEKLVIFAWHTDVLDTLQKALASYGVLRIDGSTSAKQREVRTQAFIDMPEYRVWLANMQAGGIGIDGLQKVCSRAIIAEPDWVFGNNQQAVDRLHRIGQNNTVSVDFMCAKDSILENVLETALRKGRNTYRALDARYDDPLVYSAGGMGQPGH